MAIALKTLVVVIGLLLGFLGLRWMFAPEAIAQELGIALQNAVAFSTARGDVGGMFVAGAILCGLGLGTGDGRWLQAVAIVIGCVAVGRMIGLVMDGFSANTLVPILVEVAMVGALTAAARGTAGRWAVGEASP